MTNPAVVQALAVLALTAIILVIRVRTGHPPRWWRRTVNQRRAPRASLRRPSASATGLLLNVTLIGVLPWLVYLVIRPRVGSDTSALAIATAVPVVWVIIHWIRLRRPDRAGLVVVGAYGCALALSAILGDTSTPLKLRDAGILGAVGLACVVSVVLRRPLLWLGLRYLRRHGQDPMPRAARIDDPAFRRDLTAATALAGATFLLATLVEVGLMIGVSTATFLAIAGPLGGLTPLAAIAVTIAFLRYRSGRRQGQTTGYRVFPKP